MRQHRNTVKPFLIILVVLSTGAAIVIALDWMGSDNTVSDENVFNQDQSLANDATSQPEAFSPITSANGISSTTTTGSGLTMAWDTAIGPTNAPVTIIEYGTYGCQICRQVHQIGIIDQLLADNPNDITFVYISWPIYHPNDELATEAAFCAQEQGKTTFWLYHNALFDLSTSDYNDFDQPSDYVTLARQLNLDADSLAACLGEGRFRDYIYELAAHGYELNLPGTPTFFVNGTVTRAFELESAVMTILNEKYTSDVLTEE